MSIALFKKTVGIFWRKCSMRWSA